MNVVMPSLNWRFGATAAVTPQEVQWKPPLRQAALTLSASGEQRGESDIKADTYIGRREMYEEQGIVNILNLSIYSNNQ